MKKFLHELSFTGKILLGLLLFLIVIRIFIPYGVKRGLNYYLANKIESYEGHIADLDLSLWRGAYQIEGLRLWKKGSNQNDPLIAVREIDLSLAWRALFKGEILGDLRVTQLNLQFTDSKSEEKKQNGTDEKGWNEVIQKLIPISIESAKCMECQVHFVNRDFKAPIDVVADQLELSAFNMRNVDSKNEILPSTFRLTGRFQGDSNFRFAGKFNALADPMAFNIDADMKDFTLEKLNPFLLVYGPFTFAKGKLSIYAETATKDGKIKGYVKPFLDNVKMVKNEEKFISFKHGTYEFVLGAANLLFRSSEKDVATKVEFEGPIKSPDINIWGAVKTAFKNGFGQPLDKGVEHSIGIKDVPK
ncbi:MAG: DUF748 domain-containing protein [Bdellovibrionaceae bacterium]|nr:DUF748 domain-containing protein [Pseudobdellovibrionaceae bacterium]